MEAFITNTDRSYDLGRIDDVTMTTGGRLRVDSSPSDANGPINSAASNARLLSAAGTTNATLVKSSAGRVFNITGYNANAAARYLKLYNKATAPTVGTDIPVWTEYLPAQSKFLIDLRGFYFALGIGFGLTTGVADADTGALTAADILALNLGYS